MSKRLPPEKTPSRAYVQLWRLVDGAVRDCFDAHPEYIPFGKQESVIRNSIVKRVTGLTLGYAVRAAWGRSVEKTAAEKASILLQAALDEGVDYARHRGEACVSPPPMPEGG